MSKQPFEPANSVNDSTNNSANNAVQPHWQRTLWVMFVAQVTTAIGFSVFFPFLPLFVKELGSVWNINIDLMIALAFSGQGIAMMFASPLWGALADRIGRKPMVLRATFGGAILMVLMAFSSSAEMLVFWRIVQGLVTGVMAANNALVASLVPKERSGYALGLMQTGLWSGIAIGPLVGGVLQDFLGMQAAFLLTAVLLAASGMLVLFIVRENFVPEARNGSRGFKGMWQQWRDVVRAPQMGTLFSLRFLYFLGRSMLAPFVPLFIATLVVNEARLGTTTGLIISLGSIAGTVSSVALGHLGDRIGHQRILLFCAVLGAIFYFPQAWAHSVSQLIFLQILVGLAAGGVIPAVSALINNHTAGNSIGAAFGLDNAIGSAARGTAPLLGSVVVYFWGYQGVFVASALIFVVISLVVWQFLPRDTPSRLVSSCAYD